VINNNPHMMTAAEQIYMLHHLRVRIAQVEARLVDSEDINERDCKTVHDLCELAHRSGLLRELSLLRRQHSKYLGAHRNMCHRIEYWANRIKDHE